MVDRETERKAKQARGAKLPIVTFDDRVDEQLVALGIETENDTDGHLFEHQAEHAATLYEYMTETGLITEE